MIVMLAIAIEEDSMQHTSTIQKVLKVTSLSVIFSLASCSDRDIGLAQEQGRAAPLAGDVVAHRTLSVEDIGSYSFAERMPLVIGGPVSKSAIWGEAADSTVGVLILFHNIALPSGERAEAGFEYSASYEVTAVGCHHPNVFFVAGVARNDDAVIERWESIYPAPVGGGDPDYLTAPGMLRTEIYRGDELERIHTIGPDPEGRFVLVVHGDYTADPSAGTPGAPFLSRVDVDTSEVTEMKNALDCAAIDWEAVMSVNQHVSEGRVWFVSPGRAFPRAVFYDHDNDGTFDGEALLSDEADNVGMGYTGPVWIDDFLNVDHW